MAGVLTRVSWEPMARRASTMNNSANINIVPSSDSGTQSYKSGWQAFILWWVKFHCHSLEVIFDLGTSGLINVCCMELRCPLPGGLKRMSSMVKSIGGKWSVCCREVVCFSEGLLLDFLLYMKTWLSPFRYPRSHFSNSVEWWPYSTAIGKILL